MPISLPITPFLVRGKIKRFSIWRKSGVWRAFCNRVLKIHENSNRRYGVRWTVKWRPTRPAPPNPNWNGAKTDPGTSQAPWRVYNIGAIEKVLGKKAEMEMLPLQPGDVPDTYADVTGLVEQIHYKPATPVVQGVANFVAWYRDYFKA
jgi:hypothetical protein